MYQYLLSVSLVFASVCMCVCQSHVITSNEIVQEKVLEFAIVINRHGERTPDEDEFSLSDQQEKIKDLIYVEGFEGLTNVGKRRAYQIGKYMRQRYGSQGHSILSNLYLKDEISIRSTDKERTKMTALVAMSAAYPPEHEQQWDDGIGKVWQPVPYTVVPLGDDYLRYYSSCNRFKTLMSKAKTDSLSDDFLPYGDMIALIKKNTGRNFTENPLLFQTLFDLFRSQIGLGLGIPEWAKPVQPRLAEAAKMAYKQYFRTDEMKLLGGGVLLDEFVQAAKDISSGKLITKRLRMFSAHDFNIGSLMEVTSTVGEEDIPEYGAVFALELYRSRQSGLYSVLPVYLPQAGDSSAKHLRFKNCEEYCSLTKFLENTKHFVLSEDEYHQICNSRSEL